MCSIIYYTTVYKALQVYLKTPSFILSQIYNLRQTRLPSSSVPLHDSPMLCSPRRTIVLFSQLGPASKSPHMGASIQGTPRFTTPALHHFHRFIVHGMPYPSFPSPRFFVSTCMARPHPTACLHVHLCTQNSFTRTTSPESPHDFTRVATRLHPVRPNDFTRVAQ